MSVIRSREPRRHRFKAPSLAWSREGYAEKTKDAVVASTEDEWWQ